jgi:hypothetical protein
MVSELKECPNPWRPRLSPQERQRFPLDDVAATFALRWQVVRRIGKTALAITDQLALFVQHQTISLDASLVGLVLPVQHFCYSDCG